MQAEAACGHAGAHAGGDRLTADLRALGIRPGQDLLVHCSLRRVGPVDGGAATLLAALRAAAGPRASLVVPAQTAQNSLTSSAFLAATARLSPRERARYIAAMPGFDPATTPSSGMGALAEQVRTHPEAVRSSHPQTSFAGLGPRAAGCMAAHDLGCHLGERSPLGWLYAADAAALLIGVGYAACTAFHLAEYRLPGPPPLRRYTCFTSHDGGKRTRREFTDLALDDSDFGALGTAIDPEPFVRRGRIGAAESRLLPLRAAVDFARCWFLEHRSRAIS
ncbi:MAG TPA: AAC(3) family N-acetyltransferase [Streptosporangiaceae bacterium]|nr:AAC(3) family N-acetyltransferase [Streptosporangiaceae bacterium]